MPSKGGPVSWPAFCLVQQQQLLVLHLRIVRLHLSVLHSRQPEAGAAVRGPGVAPSLRAVSKPRTYLCCGCSHAQRWVWSCTVWARPVELLLLGAATACDCLHVLAGGALQVLLCNPMHVH